MCTYCKNNHVYALFTWAPDQCEAGKKHALSNMLTFVQDVLQTPTRTEPTDDFTLSAAGARGLSLIVGAIEQQLLDVNLGTSGTVGKQEGDAS